MVGGLVVSRGFVSSRPSDCDRHHFWIAVNTLGAAARTAQTMLAPQTQEEGALAHSTRLEEGPHPVGNLA